jgi:hypothetical protein
MHPCDLKYVIKGFAECTHPNISSRYRYCSRDGEVHTVIAGSLKYPHTLFDCSLRVPRIVGWVDARQ